MNYEHDVEIDGEALDQEWLNQPKLVLKYAKHSALLQKRLDEADQNKDIAKADADKMIRSNPEKYGLEKTTDAVIANAILNEKGYQAACAAYIEAKYESGMAKGAVNAFEHRKASLENLVKLYGQQYFAGPKMPLEINREWEKKEEQKELNRKVKTGMMRRKREEGTDDDE